MVVRLLWLWLSVGWLSEAFTQPSVICELSPCKCSRGKLECDCSNTAVKDVTLKPELFDSLSLSSVKVENCLDVRVRPRAFSGLPGLRQVALTNISKVTLEEHAFSYPGDNPQLLVNISNCHIPEIPSYCFRGQLRDVLLTDVRVTSIRAYAFSSIDNAEKLLFVGVQVELMESQAFKKFTVELLSFIDSNITVIPQRAMAGVEVLQEVRLEKLRSDKVEAFAFDIHSSRSFKLVQCMFKHVEKKAFNTLAKGDVSIHENTFIKVEKEAFLGLTVDRRYFLEAGKEDLIFENNTIENIERGSLTFNTTAFNPRLDWVMINQQCSCEEVDWWATDVVFFLPDFSISTPNAGYEINQIIYCLNPKFTRLRDFQNFDCSVTKSSLYIVILVVGVLLVTFSIMLLAWFYRKKTRSKRYINVPTSSSALKPAEPSNGHILVVPEGKTYRETELQVIVEHAQPIVPLVITQFLTDSGENDRTTEM